MEHQSNPLSPYTIIEDKQMSIESQFEREEKMLGEDFDAGHLSDQEYNEAMNQLMRDYQAAAEDSAQDAYDNEMAQW